MTEPITRRTLCLGVAATVALLALPAEARPSAGPSKGRIKRMVMIEAMDLGFPVSLALAVAHAESGFDARALSKAGARGVMQIMPATAWGEYRIRADELWDPRLNIRLGLHFLNRLIRRYGQVDIALSHYNGGSAVGRPGRARVIPATRPYVNRVQRLAGGYRRQLLSGRV
ncbi:MAG: lytic transglycosylase domain-containing protein [Rhodospirillales bacterium]